MYTHTHTYMYTHIPVFWWNTVGSEKTSSRRYHIVTFSALHGNHKMRPHAMILSNDDTTRILQVYLRYPHPFECLNNNKTLVANTM